MGNVTSITAGDTALGPYPVFSNGGRIEIVEVPDRLVELTSVRNLKIKATADDSVIVASGAAVLPSRSRDGPRA